MNRNVSSDIVRLALEFVYTGGVAELTVDAAVEERHQQRQSHRHHGSQANVGVAKEFPAQLLRAARSAAMLFDLDDLKSWVDNCESGDTLFNPSIQTFA